MIVRTSSLFALMVRAMSFSSNEGSNNNVDNMRSRPPPGSESSAEELKKRFHVEKLPAIRFVSEKTKAVSDFTGAENADEIVEFVRSAVSPALRSLADIARKFSAASDKKALLEEAKKIVGTVGETDAKYAKECSPCTPPILTLLQQQHWQALHRIDGAHH